MSEAFSHRTETADGVVWRGLRLRLRSVLIHMALLGGVALMGTLLKYSERWLLVVAIALPVIAMTIFAVWVQQHRRLIVGPEGITFVRWRRNDYFLWASLAQIQMPLHLGANPYTWMTAVSPDGETAKFMLAWLPAKDLHLIAVDVATAAKPAGVRVAVSGTKSVGRAYVETMQQRRGG